MRLIRGAACATAVLCAVFGAPLNAQQPAPPSAESEALRVFLDCQNFFCDFDHFRREIPFVNWVRDRRDAQVHILGTSQRTGGGGREFTLTFIGAGSFSGKADTLKYVSRNTDTEAEIRDGQVRALKLGLMRYVALTPAAERIRISYTAPSAQAPAGPVEDPWDYWVFRTSVGGSVNGESRQRGLSVNGSLSASRITEQLKITLRLSGRYSRSEFELDSANTFVSTQRDINTDGLLAVSMGNHWSSGVLASVRSLTRLNQDLAVEMGPAVEFNIFPYGESTRRQLTIMYSAGFSHFRYEEETIFDKTEETLPRHRLQISAEARQPWGSLNASLEGSQFLHDLARHQVSLFGGAQVRLFRGLSLNLFGSVARIKDQLYLSKAGVSPEEILVRRRQLGTDYRYFADLGFSYTFGSRFNNVVNPRMNIGGGEVIIFF
ncbi:MAG: hypothetical protein KatS3mg081_2495 [Gemmatimonadales bacterium]|nr:MAG: hypothetical protein KatS3mg081_2495 [Gemmatimonadales bacterium]